MFTICSIFNLHFVTFPNYQSFKNEVNTRVIVLHVGWSDGSVGRALSLMWLTLVQPPALYLGYPEHFQKWSLNIEPRKSSQHYWVWPPKTKNVWKHSKHILMRPECLFLHGYTWRSNFLKLMKDLLKLWKTKPNKNRYTCKDNFQKLYKWKTSC